MFIIVPVLFFHLVAAANPSACAEPHKLNVLTRLQQCIDDVTSLAQEEGQQKGLKKASNAFEELRSTCDASTDKATQWGCLGFTRLGHNLLVEGLVLLSRCSGNADKDAVSTGSSDDCRQDAQVVLIEVLQAWQSVEEQHKNTPAESMVTTKLRSLRAELFPAALVDDVNVVATVWQILVTALDKLRYWVQAFIWRETQWLWLQDSLAAGRVVQTTWGDADEWLKFGVHDAHSEAPLSASSSPAYLWSDKVGMRWQMMPQLLRELHEKRGGEPLLVVEIGVFAGHLSHRLLEECDFITLVGVDPYIGSDGTFPGNFSMTLDAEVALYKASTVMDAHPGRGKLWPVTSEVAAAELPDDSVDAIFVDGCHLYDCVVSDLDLWLPKLRHGVETLVAGHDFSPQWPGVVRAVHERRAGGHQVFLASDWMYWWWERRS